MTRLLLLLLAFLPGPIAGPAAAAADGRPAAATALSWTDLADLSLASPVILRAEVARVAPLGRRVAPDVPPGEVRALVEANLVNVLKAPDALPGTARWLWQGPAGPRGRPPLARGDSLLLFLVPAGGDRDYRLLHPAGQQRWSPALEAEVRRLVEDARRPDAPAGIREIANGFHVPGTVEGESESQFFLVAEDGRPMTLTVLRRPGAAPSIAMATGDLIDESAQAIEPRTLLWRALACTLPERLPPRLAGDRGLARDYAEMRRQIGACDRTL